MIEKPSWNYDVMMPQEISTQCLFLLTENIYTLIYITFYCGFKEKTCHLE